MRKRFALTVLPALLAGTMSLALAAPAPNEFPATVRAFSPAISERSFPATSATGDEVAPEEWRVVHGTGNCCENYVASTSGGRLMDFGGSYLRFSDDQGESWSEVAGLGVLAGGEGAVVEAPNGDVVGVTWDPYSGDRLEGFKYDKADNAWTFAQNKLHTPFFDRPYITSLPGPYSVAGESVEYLSYITGGWGIVSTGGFAPTRTHYLSMDGVNYIPGTSPFPATGTSKSKALVLPADPRADAIQPLTVLGVAPLPGGGALAWKNTQGEVDLSILEPPDPTWSPFTFPGAPKLEGRLLADSQGRLHNVDVGTGSFTYRISSDGGVTWSSIAVPMPQGYQAVMPQFDRFWDFKSNGRLEMGVVSMYARNTTTGKDQNLVFVLSTDGTRPALDKVLFLGRGDKAFGTGLGAVDRLDFITVAILPDGRVASTYLDNAFPTPALAITTGSQVPSHNPAAPRPMPTTDGSPTAGPQPGSTPDPKPSVTPTPDPTSSPETPVDRTPPRITDVRDRPDPFTPNGDGRKERTKIRFSLSEDAKVSVSIFNKRGRLVKTLRDDASLAAGNYTIGWRGRNDAGKRVRAATYTYRIAAIDAAGNDSGLSAGTVTVRLH